MNANDLVNQKKAAAIVQNMKIPKLTKYIKERLTGISILPPLVTQSDEMPAYFLEKVYEQSENEDFKSKFRNAIAKLLTEEQFEISDTDYLATLFLFCERYIISEAVASVGGMALSDKLKGMQSSGGDLHCRALMALARMPQGLKMTDIWVNAITDARYTSATFAALRSQGLETILRYLPGFIRMSTEFPKSLNLKLAIKTLYEEFKDYPENKITELIEQYVEKENVTVKESLYSIFKSLGKSFIMPLKREWTYTEPISQNKLIFKIKSDLLILSTRKEKEIKQIEPFLLPMWESISKMEGKPERANKYANPENFGSSQEFVQRRI